MQNLYAEALRLADAGENFSLATVITSDGSAPRGPGAKMIIRKDRSIAGTIGGGLLEAKVMDRGVEVIRAGKAAVEEFHLTKDDFAGIDMTCGGNLSVLVDFIDAGNPLNREIFAYLSSSDRDRSVAYLVTKIPETEEEMRSSKLFVLTDGEFSAGFNEAENTSLREKVFESDSKYRVISAGGRKYICEAANIHHCAYIFGAGHVGLKIAELLKYTGFHVTVIDDRADFACADRFPFADRILAADFEESFSMIDIDRFSYIVIVTRGHAKDEVCLEKALRTEAGYIGMIGSRPKREGIYKNLMERGFTQSDIDRTHSPIGLPIGAETPEEIGISVAAEIVKARSELSK